MVSKLMWLVLLSGSNSYMPATKQRSWGTKGPLRQERLYTDNSAPVSLGATTEIQEHLLLGVLCS